MVSQKPQVFISYTHRESEREWVRQFVDALAEEGVSVWFDEQAIHPGERWGEAIDDGMRRSDIFVWLGTPESSKYPWSLFEIGAAIGMGKRIIPILPAGSNLSELPEPLRTRQILRRDSPIETARQIANCVAGTVQPPGNGSK